jgi:site-specific recombinase XerD
VAELAQVKPLRVAAYVETLLRELAKPTVKRHLAALRRLFDWAWWSAMWRKRIRRIPWAGRSMW